MPHEADPFGVRLRKGETGIGVAYREMAFSAAPCLWTRLVNGRQVLGSGDVVSLYSDLSVLIDVTIHVHLILGVVGGGYVPACVSSVVWMCVLVCWS